MSTWTSDKELFALIRAELFTAVIGDVMDKRGMQRQFLPPYLRPLDPKMIVLGRAMTVLEADVFGESAAQSSNALVNKPFGLMFEALDSLGEGEVYVCTGSSPSYALWGGLMSTRATQLKAAGAVLDGYLRDTNEILSLGFPVFSMGSYAQDQGPRGKVIDFRVPIVIGQARIEPGDLIFGDIDGVLVVPQAREAEVIEAALEKARDENKVRDALLQGMSTTDAFRTFGIM